MIEEIGVLNALKPQSHQYDDRIAATVEQLCNTYMNADAQLRKKIRESLTADFALFWFAHDMALRAVRENRAEYLRMGLLALVIEDARRDSRDTLFPLALLYHSASKLGTDVTQLFLWAASMATARMEHVLVEFLDRPAPLREISNFGFKEVQTGSGFDYASTREPSN